MEDVLEVYCRPYNSEYPAVCLDELSKFLTADLYAPTPMKAGQDRRCDDRFERKGHRNIFLACEPLAGKRFLLVRERRTGADWAHFVRELLEQHYPCAKKVVLVMDNLNTHTPAALYSTFPPQEARALLERLEIHYTPKHASWLNIAEIEFSALVRQGIAHRVESAEELCDQVLAWQEQRNRQAVTVNWHFTTADARVKLKRLYPTFSQDD